MTKSQTYCIIDFPSSMVFPAEVAVQLFPMLCVGEAAQYDWSSKQYKRETSRDTVTLKQFTIAQYAELQLNSDT
tara:strand:+ start:80 stop:301 length:222 start_codon:yes stop_codon:yes gene_type:complete